MNEIITVWLWLDMATCGSDVSKNLALTVYRIFQKLVNLFDFGGNSEDLPGHLLVARNKRAKVANHVFDCESRVKVVDEREVAAMGQARPHEGQYLKILCLELERAGLNHFEYDFHLLFEPVVKEAFRLRLDTCLQPLAELVYTSSIDLPLQVLLLLVLVIGVPGSRAEVLKQLAVFFVAKFSILNDLFELGQEDVIVLALFGFAFLKLLCCLTLLIILLFVLSSFIF